MSIHNISNATNIRVMNLNPGLWATAWPQPRILTHDYHAIGTQYTWIMPTLAIDHHGRARGCNAYLITLTKTLATAINPT